ncbi:MAG TPA: NADH-quinone oxidoreductase subunit N [Chitinophagaceae bacterium]|nr:NADH-quinone oxidoreductase subunit N [Chitinophagaceae bacterium]
MNALIVSALMGVLMMFSGILLKQKSTIRRLALAGLFLTIILNVMEMYGFHLFRINVTGMMSFDRFSLFFNTIAMACTFVFFLLSAKEMEKVGVNYSEYFALIFFILSGIILSSSFSSLLILFLGIEIISIPLYILTGSDKRNLKSNEASLKYFLLGSFSTGLMLMGITLIYGNSGSFQIDAITNPGTKPGVLLVAGLLLLMFSMAFKASAAPFHFWTPDVYDGAPTVFTSFMATIVKAAVFIAFVRLFYHAFGEIHNTWKFIIAIITALTLFIGNITAVFQQSVKRMLAYSSIAQAGFMLMAVLALNSIGSEGILLYTTAYCLSTIGLFAILVKMKDYTFEGFNGFAKHQPLLAGVAVIFLLSLAGIPLTAGFLAKFYMINAVINSGGFLWLVIFAVLMAAISVYYYFRVIQAMYFKEGEAQVIEVSAGFKWVIALVAALVILLGVFPQLLFSWFYF